MRLGIDFGTTRIVVAIADRGNYPVVSFETGEDSQEWFPPLVAIHRDERRYGWEAAARRGDPAWTVIRSLKRLLDDAGPESRIQVGARSFALLDLLTGMTAALARAIGESLDVPAGEPLEIMLGVPANANSNQRFLTIEAFRRAGFQVLGLLNEPSAASIEYGHRQKAGQKGAERILVYDLGGGTFDASLVELDARTHSVIASDGLPQVGGDDFDQLLALQALEQAGVSPETALTEAEHFRLADECRRHKESLNPNSRKIVMDLAQVRPGWGEVAVAVADYYERARPLLDETLALCEALLGAHGGAESVYVTGGGSELPLVARVLREVYGKKVRRSPYTRAATAIGLAIQADDQAGYVLRERFTRHFGVWREAEGGALLVFDPIFPRGTALPGPKDPPLEIARQYHPVHNVGHFRYLESSHLSPNGWPTGDLAVWDEIRFPFDPALAGEADLASIPVVHRNGQAQVIEEHYSCDATGAVRVAIRNLTAGYERDFRLGRWAAKDAVLEPKAPKKRGRR